MDELQGLYISRNLSNVNHVAFAQELQGTFLLIQLYHFSMENVHWFPNLTNYKACTKEETWNDIEFKKYRLTKK